MKVPINMSWNVVFSACAHYGPMGPIGPILSIEVGFQHWPPGNLLRKNKLTRNVRHKGYKIVQEGHDLGPLIPHVTFPIISNPWYVKIWPLSSNETKFSSSSVRANGKPVACASLWPPLPMVACGEPISLPFSFPINNWNTVRVGLSWRDLLAGALDIIIGLVMDFVFRGRKPHHEHFYNKKRLGNLLGKTKYDKALRTVLMKKVLRSVLGEYFPVEKSEVAEFFTRKAVSLVTGFVTSSIKGNPTLSVSLGGAGREVEVSYGKSHESGLWEFEIEAVLGSVKVNSDGVSPYPGAEHRKILGRPR